MARPRNPYAAPAVPPTQVGTPQLGSYGGVNSYNTPNVNTYVAPGGRFASGLGDNTPGLSGQIAANQHQQMLNGLSASDSKQLQLGGAAPVVPVSRQREGFIGRPSRSYVAQTAIQSPGSEAALNNVSVGGSGGAFAAASQRQKTSAEAYKALVARRFAGRNGKSVAAAVASPGGPPVAPGAQPQSVPIGANGLPVTLGATGAAAGRTIPNSTFPESGSAFDQPNQRQPFIAPQTPGRRFAQSVWDLPTNVAPYTNVPYMIGGAAADSYYGNGQYRAQPGYSTGQLTPADIARFRAQGR